MLFLKYLQFYLILDNHFLVSLNLEIVVLNLLIVLIVDLMQELQVEDHQEYLSKQTKLIASQQKEYDDLKKDLDQKKQQLQLYRLQNQRLILFLFHHLKP